MQGGQAEPTEIDEVGSWQIFHKTDKRMGDGGGGPSGPDPPFD